MNRIDVTNWPIRWCLEYFAFGYRTKVIDGRLYLQRELDS